MMTEKQQKLCEALRDPWREEVQTLADWCAIAADEIEEMAQEIFKLRADLISAESREGSSC